MSLAGGVSHVGSVAMIAFPECITGSVMAFREGIVMFCCGVDYAGIVGI